MRPPRTDRSAGLRVYLATSCLSQMPLRLACTELAMVGMAAVEHGYIASWGLQLCPGHRDVAGVDGAPVALHTPNVRLHHGFDWYAPKRNVWLADGTLANLAADGAPTGFVRTIHPPMVDGSQGGDSAWIAHAEGAIEGGSVEAVEAMYAGYTIHSPATIPALPLAVDVSHMNLWGDERSLRAFDRSDVREVHVSANDGRADQHRPLTPGSYGIGWALEQARDGVPLVLEISMRHLNFFERLRQVRILSEA